MQRKQGVYAFLPILRSFSDEGRKRPRTKKLLFSFYPGLKPWAMDSFPNKTLLSLLNMKAMGSIPGIKSEQILRL
jgi:hypothetical protein